MFKSGIIVMIITMVSRILGLVRGTMIAYFFGSNAVTDAFFSAFKVSNFFRQLLGEGALGNVFIPLYNEKVEKDGENTSRQLIFSIINIIFIFSTIVTILMIVFSDRIIAGLVSGFAPETKQLASKLLKIMSFYFIFISLAGMISAILNNFKRFIIPASTSIFFNFSIIIATIYFNKSFGIEALAYGVTIGGILQLIVVLPQFIKILKVYSFKIDWKDPYLKRIFILMLPMLVGIVARQVNTIVDQVFASHLTAGGVSALENATRVYLLPVGVFGISLSTVIFPTLSRATAKENYELVEKTLIKGLNILIFLIIPSMFVLIFYSQDIIKLILGYGKFGDNAKIITSDALRYYSIGLYFYTGVHLMTRAFYSMKDTKHPLRFALVSICVNILLNFILIGAMEHKGLALATAVASGVNFTLLLYFFRSKYLKISLKPIFIFLIKTLVVGIISYLVSFTFKNPLIRLLIFSLAYLICWSKEIISKKSEMF